jgi:hypothetical protein
MQKNFYCRILRLLVWLTEKAFHISISDLECEKCHHKPDRKIIVFRTIRSRGLKIIGDIKMAELREGQQVTVTASPKTKKGKPATYEKGSASWETSDDAIATVEANPDNELEAIVKGVDGSDNESVVITFKADGDPDEDERPIIGTLDVTVTQGEATVFELSAGTASDTPEETTGGGDEGTTPEE